MMDELFCSKTLDADQIVFNAQISEQSKIIRFIESNNMSRIVDNKIWQNQIFTESFFVVSNFRRKTFSICKPRWTNDISKIQDNN